MKTLKDFSDDELEKYLREEHVNKLISLRELARRLDTNATRLFRFCNKRNIPVLSKSESLKAGYDQNRCVPPALGKPWSEERKREFAETVHENWESLPEAEKERRREVQREIFEGRPDKEEFTRKGARAIRRAAIYGSKSEHALAALFEKNGISFQHHYSELLPHTKLEVDFYLLDYNCVVEIDGPSHFAVEMGSEQYRKQLEADLKKNALVLKMGASIIRLRHEKKLYPRDHLRMLEYVKSVAPTLENELREVNVKDI